MDPNDARSKILQLTKAGKALLSADPLQVVSEVLETLPDHDLEHTASITAGLLEAIFKRKAGSLSGSELEENL